MGKVKVLCDSYGNPGNNKADNLMLTNRFEHMSLHKQKII